MKALVIEAPEQANLVEFPPGEYQSALNTLVSRQRGTLKVLLVHEGEQK